MNFEAELCDGGNNAEVVTLKMTNITAQALKKLMMCDVRIPNVLSDVDMSKKHGDYPMDAVKVQTLMHVISEAMYGVPMMTKILAKEEG